MFSQFRDNVPIDPALIARTGGGSKLRLRVVLIPEVHPLSEGHFELNLVWLGWSVLLLQLLQLLYAFRSLSWPRHSWSWEGSFHRSRWPPASQLPSSFFRTMPSPDGLRFAMMMYLLCSNTTYPQKERTIQGHGELLSKKLSFGVANTVAINQKFFCDKPKYIHFYKNWPS